MNILFSRCSIRLLEASTMKRKTMLMMFAPICGFVLLLAQTSVRGQAPTAQPQAPSCIPSPHRRLRQRMQEAGERPEQEAQDSLRGSGA